MAKIKTKTLFGLGIVALLALTSCGPTNDPTTNVPTDPSTETTTDPLPPSEDKSLITEECPEGLLIRLGDQMYDTSFRSIDGYDVDLFTELAMKEMIVINFFASWCGPCQSEFPAMEEAYREYSDVVSFIAVSVESSDTPSILKRNFQDKYDTTFEICMDTNSFWLNHLVDFSLPPEQVGAIPHTIMIDRYGTVVENHLGSIVSANTWKGKFAKYTGPDYVPPVFGDRPSLDSGTTSGNPGTTEEVIDIEMPSSIEIEGVINDASYPFGYYNATGNDAKNNWPWVISDDRKSIHPSNIEKDSSYSIINSDFVVSDIYNNVLTFDYLSSTEEGYDVLYVIVDDVIVKEISGYETSWKTAYAYVPLETGEHTLTLVYSKDEGSSAGDDTVYVKNMRFINVEDINEDMHVKRPVATNYNEKTGKYTKYNDVFFNEADGYYHVDSVDGPLLLAELIKVTPWDSHQSVYGLVIEGLVTVDGVDYSEILTEYAQLGNNSTIGLTPITKELQEALEIVINANGDDESDKQWLEVCYYYSPYGPTAEHLPSPIYGLSPIDPIKGSLGTDTVVEFDTVLMPRGKYVEFVPEQTGAYEFTSISDYGVYGSIIDEEGNVLYESTDFSFEKISGLLLDDDLKMYAYLEANKTYYLRVAFNFPDQLGEMNIGISYVGETYEYMVLASTSTAFTTKDEDFNIEDPDNLISINVPYEIDEDGYYRHKRADGSLGSYIYADFINPSSMFYKGTLRITLEMIIEEGGSIFEFYTDPEDLEATTTIDLTDEFEKYIKLSYESISEDNPYGLIPVNEEIAYILQVLMDAYTFYGVEDSWMKLCYFKDYFGPLSK